MHFTPLIRMVVPKCKFPLEREGTVRSRFTSPWGCPVLFKATSYPGCCVGCAVTLSLKGLLPCPCGRLAMGAGRRRGTWFPLGRLYKLQKGSHTVSLQVIPWGGQGKWERSSARKGWGGSAPEKAGGGRARCCSCLGRGNLLLCGERRGEKNPNRLLRTFKTLYARIQYALSRPARGVIGLQITCLEWWECTHCKLNVAQICRLLFLKFSYCIFLLRFYFIFSSEQKRIIDRLKKLRGQPVVF